MKSILYNFKMVKLSFLISVVLLFPIMGPAQNQKISPALSFSPDPTIAKWYNNCAAAISLTYDDGRPKSKMNQAINKLVLENGLTIDYELVTYDYMLRPKLKDYLLEIMIPSGLGYFGHGHKHVNHDRLSYEAALMSFKQCYKIMLEFGLKPVAYAYPGGKGIEMKTKKALAEAGFLSGRVYFSKKMNAPYIVPGLQVEPDDWFGLPTLVMQDYSFSHCKSCVNNNEQLIPYLDRTISEKAWIILTYHAIGNEKNYGFFKYTEFQKNILAIKERNFWNASMNAVTLYIKERLHAQIKIEPAFKNGKIEEMAIALSDNLPNDIYSQPLTILFRIPKEWLNQSIVLEKNGQPVKTFVFVSTNAMISLIPDETELKLKKVIIE